MSALEFFTLEVDDDTFVEPVQLQFRCCGPHQRALRVDVDGAGLRPVRGLERGGDGLVRADSPAWACPVEDSGAGVSWLVHGGNAGVWLAPDGAAQPDPDDPRQLIDAYLLVDRADLELVEG